MQQVKGCLGYRNNAFISRSPPRFTTNTTRGDGQMNSPSMDKENASLRFVQAHGRDDSNPPLKLHNSITKSPHSHSKSNFISSSHKKLESTLSNIDEKLHVMVSDHNKLKSTVHLREQEVYSQEQRVNNLMNDLEEARDLAQRYKQDKEELVKKIKVLLKENEKSTSLVQLLAKQDEEQRDEYNSTQQMYQDQICELEQVNRDQANEIQEMDAQLQEYQSNLQEYEARLGQLNEENEQLKNALDESNERNNIAFQEHISQLIQQNEDLSQQLMNKQKQLQIYQELEGKVDRVIQENERYKSMNDKLHDQLRQHEELLFNAETKQDESDFQCQLEEKDKTIRELNQKLKNSEIKLSVMSEDNIRLNRLIQGRKISEKLNL